MRARAATASPQRDSHAAAAAHTPASRGCSARHAASDADSDLEEPWERQKANSRDWGDSERGKTRGSETAHPQPQVASELAQRPGVQEVDAAKDGVVRHAAGRGGGLWPGAAAGRSGGVRLRLRLRDGRHVLDALAVAPQLLKRLLVLCWRASGGCASSARLGHAHAPGWHAGSPLWRASVA